MKRSPGHNISKVLLAADSTVLIAYAERPGNKGLLEVWRPNRDSVTIDLKLHLEQAAQTHVSKVAFGQLGSDHLVAVAHYRLNNQEQVVSSSIILFAVHEPRQYHALGSIDLERRTADHLEIGAGSLFVKVAGVSELFAVDLTGF